MKEPENENNAVDGSVESSGLSDRARSAYFADTESVFRKVIKKAKPKRWEKIRDFALIEPNRGFGSRIVIFHIPSGVWKGFSLDFEDAKEKLSNSNGDKDLLDFLFQV